MFQSGSEIPHLRVGAENVSYIFDAPPKSMGNGVRIMYVTVGQKM